MAQTQTYNLANVALTVGGVDFSSGAGDNEKVTFTRKTALSAIKVDGLGNGTAEIDNDRSGTIAVSLMQTNPLNAEMTKIFAKRESEKGAYFVAIKAADKNGSDECGGDECTPAKWPDPKYAKATGVNVWTFESAYLKMSLGGGA